MTGRFKQALLEMKKSKKGRKGKMPKNFSVSSGDKSKAGGLTKKGVKRYRAANPGSELKTAVTTKPSKLKKGSKSAKRRKSFCSRMGGMKKKLTSKKTASDPDSRINKALRKWNCSTDVNPNALQQMAEMVLNGIQENDEREIGDALKALRSNLPRANKKPEPPKPKHTRRNSLGLAGTVTPNQPDYVRNKLYNRPTKNKRMAGDSDDDATEREPIEKINRRGMTNKSAARQSRWARKQDRIIRAANRAGGYADAEYKDIMKGGDKDFN